MGSDRGILHLGVGGRYQGRLPTVRGVLTVDVKVLLSSGEEDEWQNVRIEMSMDLGGALLIYYDSDEDPVDEDNNPGSILAIYAPGMWMRTEVNRDEDD